MLIKRSESILPSEITDESVYLRRRDLLKVAGMAAVGGTLTSQALFASGSTSGISGRELSDVQKSPYSTDQEPNSWSDVTTYNNYYEFGTTKVMQKSFNWVGTKPQSHQLKCPHQQNGHWQQAQHKHHRFGKPVE